MLILVHVCFGETPSAYSKDQTEQAQLKDLRDHAKCHSNCRSPSSALGMPQWFRCQKTFQVFQMAQTNGIFVEGETVG